MPHDVFLSYASADRAAADAVCAALEARGIACWMAPRDVPAGADWGEAILTAIGRAHAMVLVLSRQTAGSVHVRNEVVTAVSLSLALVPVRIEDCQPAGALRLHLAGCHWLNVFPPPIDQHADTLAAGVRLALAADATIEVPRGQAAAMRVAARAAMPGTAAGRSEARQGVAQPAASGPAAAARVPDPAPHLPKPARGRGVALLLGLVLLLLASALGVAAWMFESELRAMLGARPSPTGEARAGPPPQSAPAALPDPPAEPAAPPRAAGSIGGFALPFRLPLPDAAPSEAAPAPVVPAPPLAADPARARLLNVAQETISRLFVAPTDAGLGREDWLGQAQITPGNAVLLRAPAGQGCVFNLRVVYVSGRTEDRSGVNLCVAGELRFEGAKGVAGSSRP